MTAWLSSGDAAAPGPPDLAGVLRFQQIACRDAGSALYDRLVGHTIDRLGRPGPIAELLGPRRSDPFGSALALRYLGSVHRIVLEGRAPALAAHYPSMGGRPGPGLEDAFDQVVADHFPELGRLVELGVQTNEVGRSATLLGAFLHVARSGRPLRVLELGASAGLNLRWDQFRYEARGSAFGPADSPVRFVEPWMARHPDLTGPVEVVERGGCDRSPIDATEASGRLTLRSFIWPDLVARFERLDHAIEVARRVPAVVDEADAVEWVGTRLADPVGGTATVIVHSIVLQYLTAGHRDDLQRTIADAGRRAVADAPIAWVRMEPGRNQAELRITEWPGGSERLLATSSYHGPPVHWHG